MLISVLLTNPQTRHLRAASILIPLLLTLADATMPSVDKMDLVPEDINAVMKGLLKRGSPRAISSFIAIEGAVTRENLREKFKSGSLRTTIHYLKDLGLIYSHPGRNGFVVSIPWLLFLVETKADWKSALKAKIPSVDEEDLRKIEEMLQEARRGVLGDFVRKLVEISRYDNLYTELVSKTGLINAIPEKCLHPETGQWIDAEVYYEECLRPLLQYVSWLLAFASSIILSLYLQSGGPRKEDLINMLKKQSQDLEKDGSNIWVLKLYSKTMNFMARLLSEADKIKGSGIVKNSESLLEYYGKKLEEIKDHERFNMSAVLRSFIEATIAKILTSEESIPNTGSRFNDLDKQ